MHCTVQNSFRIGSYTPNNQGGQLVIIQQHQQHYGVLTYTIQAMVKVMC